MQMHCLSYGRGVCLSLCECVCVWTVDVTPCCPIKTTQASFVKDSTFSAVKLFQNSKGVTRIEGSK